MNAYSVPNKVYLDNNYNNYGPKEGDKSGYAFSSTDKYDNDKYKKYDNDEPKDNLNDYKKNYRISDSVTIPVSDKPTPECVPEGGSFAGDNDFCSMALVACEPRDQYVYWSKPDCGCGCKPAATAYEKYYKSETNSNSDEYGMEKDTKPEPQYTSNNGEYIQNGYEMNAYSVPNKDNNYNNYGPKEGDKYDNDKYKKYDN